MIIEVINTYKPIIEVTNFSIKTIMNGLTIFKLYKIFVTANKNRDEPMI